MSIYFYINLTRYRTVNLPFNRITKPAVFQGDLNKKRYFEGWYYKQVSEKGNHIISVIPGISLSSDPHSFIQLIDGINGRTDYIAFPVQAFHASGKNLSINIGDNQFTDKEIRLNLDREKFSLKGTIAFKNAVPWKGNIISPGIMGWYSWMPFMECYHGVVSLDHTLEGTLIINEITVDFSGGRGYIEKDWGRSFPECWVWAQANCFDIPGTSVMFSVAKIPWLGSFFVGFLCFLLHNDKVYKFMTWNGSRLSSLRKEGNQIYILLSGKEHYLELILTGNISGIIKAPVYGSMERHIRESVDAEISFSLSQKHGKEIFSGNSLHAGLEIVGDIFRYFRKHSG